MAMMAMMVMDGNGNGDVATLRPCSRVRMDTPFAFNPCQMECPFELANSTPVSI
jgi:hypothetical protein